MKTGPRFHWSPIVALFLLTARPVDLQAASPHFYFGNDLSYVNQMEDCGGVYRENGVARDPYAIFADHGTNLVRVRLWNDPWWQTLLPQSVSGVKPQYSDLDDAIETITRAKANGMHVLLDFQFSDIWADPSRQILPRAWSDLMNDDAAIAAAVHDYVVDVLTTLDGLELMPELVQLGNETNGGLMIDQTLNATWNAGTGMMTISAGGIHRAENEYFAAIWNAAIAAVREVGATADIDPRICLHAADPDNAAGFLDWMQQIGVTDFDVIGLSYYYAWHGGSIAGTGGNIRELRTGYPDHEVLIVETGYPWDGENIDGLGNIISDPDPAFLPVNQQNQRNYMVALTQEVIDAGGIGVVFWEPGWISTPCRTPWGVGSSHEHVAYFDHRNNNNFHIGGTWMEANYASLPPKLTVTPVDMKVADGNSAFFSVSTSDPGATYQWRRNGVDLSGATSAALLLTNVNAADVGNYSVAVSNPFGTTESGPAALTIAPNGVARFLALSTRAEVGRGDQVLIPGLTVSGDVAATVLVRAIGPGLGDYGVIGVLEDPEFSIFRSLPGGGSEKVAGNNDWEDNPDLPGFISSSQSVGAFDLPAGSHDAAMLLVLNPGSYTIVISGVGDTEGVALMEVYLVEP